MSTPCRLHNPQDLDDLPWWDLDQGQEVFVQCDDGGITTYTVRMIQELLDKRSTSIVAWSYTATYRPEDADV